MCKEIYITFTHLQAHNYLCFNIVLTVKLYSLKFWRCESDTGDCDERRKRGLPPQSCLSELPVNNVAHIYSLIIKQKANIEQNRKINQIYIFEYIQIWTTLYREIILENLHKTFNMTLKFSLYSNYFLITFIGRKE